MADKLVEVTRLQDELASWTHGGATIARVNSNCYMALEEAVGAAIELVQPTGLSFHEQAHRLLAWIREIAAHGICHGAMAALAATHLCLHPVVDLRAMEPGFR